LEYEHRRKWGNTCRYLPFGKRFPYQILQGERRLATIWKFFQDLGIGEKRNVGYEREYARVVRYTNEKGEQNVTQTKNQKGKENKRYYDFGSSDSEWRFQKTENRNS
jgi:hypothetical protein